MTRTIVVVWPAGWAQRFTEAQLRARFWFPGATFRVQCDELRKVYPGVRIWEEFS